MNALLDFLQKLLLDELDAHGMTPKSAPHTWEFLGKTFMYHDIVKAVRQSR